MIYMLAEMGAAINARDSKGQLPLHLAIKSQQETSANFLLSLGCDVNALDDNGDTPLHYAVQV
jgi:ankyrin repeat protein